MRRLTRTATAMCASTKMPDRRLNIKPGKRFGRLTIVSECDRNSTGARTFRVICDCGKERAVVLGNLTSGNTKGCGCNRRSRRTTEEAKRERKTKYNRTLAIIRTGLTEEQYENLRSSQQNRCAICERPERRKSRNGRVMSLAVDHDHGTGRIRELLCHACNLGIGNFEENMTFLQNAIYYLKKHSEISLESEAA